MHHVIRNLWIALGLAFVSTMAIADDVKDGKAMVKPEKGDQYSIDGYKFGKAELFGYVSDSKDRNHLTGIVLTKANTASAAQRHVISQIAKTLELEAFTQEGETLTPLTE